MYQLHAWNAVSAGLIFYLLTLAGMSLKIPYSVIVPAELISLVPVIWFSLRRTRAMAIDASIERWARGQECQLFESRPFLGASGSESLGLRKSIHKFEVTLLDRNGNKRNVIVDVHHDWISNGTEIREAAG